MVSIGVVLGVILGAIGVAFVVGSALPRDHVARMGIDLGSSREAVWSYVSDVGGAARWRSDLRRVDMKPAPDGILRYVEVSKHREIPFEVVGREPPLRQVVRVLDDDQPFGGTWTWELEATDGGTRLVITEAGFVKNPILRLVGKWFFPPTATIDAYLRSLAKALGETAQPRVLP